MPKESKKSFTLIELLITLSIIGILVLIIGIINFQESHAKARDAARMEEAYQLRLALELYYDEYGEYPHWASIGSDAGVCLEEGEGKAKLGSALVDKGYISSLPEDPKYNSSVCSNGASPSNEKCFCYIYRTDTAQKFKVFAKTERENDKAVNDGGVYPAIYEVYSPTSGSEQISIKKECLVNNDCLENWFCEFSVGECTAPGECVKKPEVCPTLYSPVCGCNNITYPNDCGRKVAGVSKLHDGGCVVVKYPLTVSKAGAGSGTVTSSPPGINCGADCTEGYVSGTLVTLNAAPDVNSTFAGWSGCDSVDLGACFVTVNAVKSVTATFNPIIGTCTLTISKAGMGFGNVSVSPPGDSCPAVPELQCYSYACGTTVNLTAVANSGSTFAGWSGACAGPSPICAVVLDTNKSVIATFNVSGPITILDENFDCLQGTGGCFSFPCNIPPPAGWATNRTDTGAWVTGVICPGAYRGTNPCGLSAAAYQGDPWVLPSWMSTKALSLKANKNYTLTFWYRIAGTCAGSGGQFGLRIYRSNSQSSLGTQLGSPYTIQTTTFTLGTINFTVPSDGTYYIQFEAVRLTGGEILIIDDVKLVEQ